MPCEIQLFYKLVKSISVFKKFEERYHTQMNNATPKDVSHWCGTIMYSVNYIFNKC